MTSGNKKQGDRLVIDINKVRKWSVRFNSPAEIKSLPYPEMIVEEVEKYGYKIPQCSPLNIPAEMGGQITLVLSGHGILRVGDKKYDCLPGTAFLYRHCDPEVSYRTAANSKWHFIWINFQGIASERLIAEINRYYGYFFYLGQDSILEKTLLNYKHYSGSSFKLSAWEGAKFAVDLMGMLCGKSNDEPVCSSGFQLVNEAKAEIRKSFNEPLNGELLAKKIGVSRDHLSKTFHQETGINLHDYISEQRLNEALSLLMKSNLNCKEIAAICNYGSYSQFFRTFKKVYGVSPDEFRKAK